MWLLKDFNQTVPWIFCVPGQSRPGFMDFSKFEEDSYPPYRYCRLRWVFDHMLPTVHYRPPVSRLVAMCCLPGCKYSENMEQKCKINPNLYHKTHQKANFNKNGLFSYLLIYNDHWGIKVVRFVKLYISSIRKQDNGGCTQRPRSAKASSDILLLYLFSVLFASYRNYVYPKKSTGETWDGDVLWQLISLKPHLGFPPVRRGDFLCLPKSELNHHGSEGSDSGHLEMVSVLCRYGNLRDEAGSNLSHLLTHSLEEKQQTKMTVFIFERRSPILLANCHLHFKLSCPCYF